jgi:hypothetical protein
LSLEVAAVVPGLAAVEVPEVCFNQAATKLHLQQYESWWVKVAEEPNGVYPAMSLLTLYWLQVDKTLQWVRQSLP